MEFSSSYIIYGWRYVSWVLRNGGSKVNRGFPPLTPRELERRIRQYEDEITERISISGLQLSPRELRSRAKEWVEYDAGILDERRSGYLYKTASEEDITRD